MDLSCSRKSLFKKLKEAYGHKEKKIRKRWKEFMIMLVHSFENKNIVNG